MRELQITCSGYDIVADWYDGVDTSKILLVLPGFSSSKAAQARSTRTLVEATGMSALVVDFSGHGKSPFRLRETRPAQHFLELICVFDWLKAQYPDAEITVSGHSYGGFLGVQLTKYRSFANLILRAPAIYPPADFYNPWSIRLDDCEAFDKTIAIYRHDREALAAHPLLGRAAKFEGRVLVAVHGKDDIVTTETTDAYITAFKADSFVAADLSHSFIDSPPSASQRKEYYDHIIQWLRH